MSKSGAKRSATKTIHMQKVWSGDGWVVHYGELKRGRGNHGRARNLFRCLGEKLPWEALSSVRNALHTQGIPGQGIYIAHDSMGCPRYTGRGNIFGRLGTHGKSHPRELRYFSFYVVEEKKHEREVETLLIRASSFLLEFNDRKKRVGVAPGNVHDYEAGTHFFERQYKKGKARKKPTRRSKA